MGVTRNIFGLPFSLRQWKLARSRPSLSREEFVGRVKQGGGDEVAAGYVFDALKEWIYPNNFTPYPSDSLQRVYGITEEELDEDMILRMFRAFGIPVPDKQTIDKFGEVDTPTRIAQLVSMARGE